MFIEIKGTEANRVEDMTFHYILKDELGKFKTWVAWYIY